MANGQDNLVFISYLIVWLFNLAQFNFTNIGSVYPRHIGKIKKCCGLLSNYVLGIGFIVV